MSAIVSGAPNKIPRGRGAVAGASPFLEKYVGEYQVGLPPVSYTITNEGGKLMVLESGYPKVEMFAESETKFFLKNEDIQFTFVKDSSGAVTGLIVHQGDSTLYEVMTGEKIK